jgi:pyruvate formate lyase activating enzyme
VDPIEKKPLNHFLPGTPTLSFGTAGCNLGCRFCQNWDISKSREARTLAERAAPETIARAAADLGCASVAFTYNDPIIFHEYAIATAEACRARGVRTVAVTAGYIGPAARAEFFRWMDAANIDLKAFTERFYRKLCAARLAPVLDTLRYVRHETDCWMELTTLLIPGENDGDEEIAAMARWVVEELGPDVPMHFTAFHPTWRLTDRGRTPAATVHRARDIALEHGVQHAYTGNIITPRGEGTSCPACGTQVIGRDGYVLTAWHLTDDGHCRTCNTRCPGVFDGPPGRWGSRRMPVRLKRYERKGSR